MFASGRDHDYTRLKRLVAKLDRCVSELEAEAIEAKQRAIAAEDENTKLRSALESGVRSLVPPPLGGSDDDGSQSANGSLLSLTGSNASYVSVKEDASYVSVNKQQKKREGSKRRMTKQAKKATDLVQSGHVLTRAGISALTKAEPEHTYLQSKKAVGEVTVQSCWTPFGRYLMIKRSMCFVVELSRRRFVLVPPLFDLLCHNESPTPP